MPTYNVKGRTIVKWDIQVDAANIDDAIEKACEEAESALDAGELEYTSADSEIDSFEDVTADCKGD